MKWSFIPQGDGKPHYLVVNADESEPGTCKDIPLMIANPHSLVEGMIIAAYAIRAQHAFIYCAARWCTVLRRLQHAVARGLRGRLPRHGHPRLRLRPRHRRCTPARAPTSAARRRRCSTPSRAAAASPGCGRRSPPWRGSTRRPTVVNNVETIASVPAIVRDGEDWFTVDGHREVPGLHAVLAVRPRHRPGQYEAPLGITLRVLLDSPAGCATGHELKFWTPGGSSTPMLTAEHLDVPLDYEGIGAAGSMLGTKALQIFDETTCVVRAVLPLDRVLRPRVVRQVHAVPRGHVLAGADARTARDGHGPRGGHREAARHLPTTSWAKSFCALGDGAASPIISSLKYFRDEYVAHLDGGGCPFDPHALRR